MPHGENTKSMELSLEEAKVMAPWKFDEKGKLREGDKAPKYPDGLELRLDNTILKKLGMKVSDFKMGEDKALVANVRVEHVRSEETLGNDPEDSITLQITEMAVAEEESDLADKIYK